MILHRSDLLSLVEQSVDRNSASLFIDHSASINRWDIDVQSNQIDTHQDIGVHFDNR